MRVCTTAYNIIDRQGRAFACTCYNLIQFAGRAWPALAPAIVQIREGVNNDYIII